MIAKAVARNREAIYAILGSLPLQSNAITPSLGSAFMVAPGLLITAAHCILDGSEPAKAPRENLRVIRAPDIGKKAEPVVVVASDGGVDLALLRIDAPRSTACLKLLDAPVPVGTHCGTSGFPCIMVDSGPRSGISHIELFQGADISSFIKATGPDGDAVSRYETDSPLFGDSSGCPGFVESGEVFGMCRRSVVDPPGNDGMPGGSAGPSGSGVTMWVPSMDIIAFAKANGVALRS